MSSSSSTLMNGRSLTLPMLPTPERGQAGRRLRLAFSSSSASAKAGLRPWHLVDEAIEPLVGTVGRPVGFGEKYFLDLHSVDRDGSSGHVSGSQVGSGAGRELLTWSHQRGFEPKDTRRRTHGSVLERHDIPQVLTGNLTNQPGHDLATEIDVSVCASAHRSAAHNETPTKPRCTPMSLCRLLTTATRVDA